MDLGHLFSRQNRLAESRSLFERALKLDGSREEVYNALSVVADLQGNAAESVTILRRAVTKGVAGEMTYINLGNLYARQQNFQQAIQFFDLARAKNPENAKILFALGICHLKVGNRDKGKALLERVVQLEPQHQDARKALAELTRK
jgi:Flp pilus assembly protein TadD